MVACPVVAPSERLDIVSPAARGNPRGVTDKRQTLGRAAEDAAARFLQGAGLAIAERNVRFAEGEIDLVCRDHGVVERTEEGHGEQGDHQETESPG